MASEEARKPDCQNATRRERATIFRLPPRHRLRSARDFARIYRTGSRARGQLMSVVLFPAENEYSRFGLSVSKRCWKNAVQRNRVRRVFREAFRLTLPELEEPIDVILIASTPRLEARLGPVQEELRRLLALALRRHRDRAARQTEQERQEREAGRG